MWCKRLILLWSMVCLSVVATHGQVTTFYVNNDVPCVDGPTGGTEATPYCTFNYVQSIAAAGRTYIFSSRRDLSGPVSFVRRGTATAPITYRSTTRTKIGKGIDLVDEDFQPTATPGIFTLTLPAGTLPGQVWQTFYPPQHVDDAEPPSSGQSVFDMVDTNGPLQMNLVPDDATLQAVEGSFRNVNGVLTVHTFGNRTPSATATDLVFGQGASLNFDSNATYLVLEGFHATYVGSGASMQINGTNHIVRNMKWTGVPMTIRGQNHLIDGFEVNHFIRREADGKYLWHWHASGTAATVGGNHRLRNGRIYHNWNSSISTELTGSSVFENITLYGAPNHCGIGSNGRQIVRNVVMYNCQDYQWTVDNLNMLYEHLAMPGGIGLEAADRALGPITVRNSIFSGSLRWVRGLASRCTWEPGSIIEHNVISTTATIQRCADMRHYPIAQYAAKCASGEFPTGTCATVRNNRMVDPSQWSTVLTGGMWTRASGDAWDVTLVPNSPALNVGASTTPTDILGVARPQPAAGLNDAGIYEVGDTTTPVNCVVSDWSPWAATGPPTFANWAQTLTQARTRTITTPPANGGTACPELTETRTVAQPCETITVTPALLITCNVAASGVQKK